MRSRLSHFISLHSSVVNDGAANTGFAPSQWRWLLNLGIGFLVSGMIAIALPQLVTSTLNVLFGVLLLLIGIATAYYAYQVRFMSYDRWPSLTSLTLIVCGLLLIVFPKFGAISITLIIAIFFIFTGLGKLTLAQLIRPHTTRLWIFFSGFIDLCLSFLIFFNLNNTADWLLGLLLGISLIVQGLWNIRLSLLIRKASEHNFDAN